MNVPRETKETKLKATNPLEQIIEIARTLQAENLGNETMGPRSVFLLLEHIVAIANTQLQTA
jgi:hypothetical protein